jgi:hypothetical protein
MSSITYRQRILTYQKHNDFITAFPDGPMRCEVNSDELKNIPSDDLMTSNPDNIYTRLPRYCINGAALKFQEKNLIY